MSSEKHWTVRAVLTPRKARSFLIFILTESHQTVHCSLILTTWPQTHGSCPASASQVLGLQSCTTTANKLMAILSYENSVGFYSENDSFHMADQNQKKNSAQQPPYLEELNQEPCWEEVNWLRLTHRATILRCFWCHCTTVTGQETATRESNSAGQTRTT